MFVEHEHAFVHNYLFPEVSRVDVAADSACAVHHDRRVRGHVLKMGWKLHAARGLCRRLIEGVLQASTCL